MNLPRIFALFAVFVLVILIARADDAPKAPSAKTDAISLTIIFNDGREINAECLTPTLRLETEVGISELRLAKLRSVDFFTLEGVLEANAELYNRDHAHGKVLTDRLQLEKGESVEIANLREIKIRKKPDTSLVAIIFGLVTLAAMEIVLGIDNIIFLAIVAGRLPPEQQRGARRLGLMAALGTRLGLLFTLSWLLGLTKPVLSLPFKGLSPDAAELSFRDMILIVGGAFLIFKSVRELHHKLEESKGEKDAASRKPASFVKTILLIALIDIVFSLDSVITAVGMVDNIWVMVAAMVIAMIVMLLFAEPVSKFVESYPTVKVLALSFLILIGVLLVAEGLGQHIEKGYVYFAMAFAVLIEFINLKLRPKPVAEAIAEG